MSNTRACATVVYPELYTDVPFGGLPAFLCYHLQLNKHVTRVLVSPLHDQDINPDTGEPKKPHYHVLVYADYAMSRSAWLELFGDMRCVGCEQVRSFKAYALYLCHLNSPDKVQYNVRDVESFGFNYDEFVSKRAVPHPSRADHITALLDLINNERLSSYQELIQYCYLNQPDLLGDCYIYQRLLMYYF